MNRKAGINMGSETAGGFILLAIVILASIAVAIAVIAAMRETGNAHACYAQGAMSGRLLKDPLSGKKALDWDCAIVGPLKVTRDDLKEVPPWKLIPEVTLKAYGGKQQILDPNTLPEYNTHAIIAKQMKSCWIKSGYGREKLFDSIILSKEMLSNLGALINGQKVDYTKIHTCGLCTVLYFDEEAQGLLAGRSEKDMSEGLTKYLKTHPAELNGEKSYWQYFNFDADAARYGVERPLPYSIEASFEDPLVVYFLRIPSILEAEHLRTGVNNPGIFIALGSGGGLISRAVKGAVGQLGLGYALNSITGGAWDKFQNEFMKDAAQGKTHLMLSRLSELRTRGPNGEERCALIANSFAKDKNIRTMFT